MLHTHAEVQEHGRLFRSRTPEGNGSSLSQEPSADNSTRARVGSYDFLPLPSWDSHWVYLVRTVTTTRILVCNCPVWSRKTLSHCTHSSLLSFIVFPLPLRDDSSKPVSEEERYRRLTLILSLHGDQLWVSVLTGIYCKKKLL